MPLGRGEKSDGWVLGIEHQLNDVRELRQSKKKISYARTRQLKARTKKASKRCCM